MVHNLEYNLGSLYIAYYHQTEGVYKLCFKGLGALYLGMMKIKLIHANRPLPVNN